MPARAADAPAPRAVALVSLSISLPVRAFLDLLFEAANSVEPPRAFLVISPFLCFILGLQTASNGWRWAGARPPEHVRWLVRGGRGPAPPGLGGGGDTEERRSEAARRAAGVAAALVVVALWGIFAALIFAYGVLARTAAGSHIQDEWLRTFGVSGARRRRGREVARCARVVVVLVSRFARAPFQWAPTSSASSCRSLSSLLRRAGMSQASHLRVTDVSHLLTEPGCARPAWPAVFQRLLDGG